MLTLTWSPRFGTDGAVTNGTTYWYKVSAVNAIGEGPASNEQSASPAAVPGAPTGLSAQPAKGKGIQLAWSAPTNNGGSPITGYRVYRDSALRTTVTSLSFKDTATISGMTYTYTVTAVNAAGESAPSNSATATAS